MEHVVVYFKHSIQDIIPYCEFVSKQRNSLAESGLGEYLGDDMAIDGGEAESVFSAISSKTLFEFIKQDLCALPFMAGAKVTLVYGELDADSPTEVIFLAN